MSTYELDDEVVRRWLKGSETAARDEIDKALAGQLPLPTPTNIAAVVITQQHGVRNQYIRWAWDSHTHEPWINVNDNVNTYRTDQIGRIVDVPFEGLDL